MYFFVIILTMLVLSYEGKADKIEFRFGVYAFQNPPFLYPFLYTLSIVLRIFTFRILVLCLCSVGPGEDTHLPLIIQSGPCSANEYKILGTIGWRLMVPETGDGPLPLHLSRQTHPILPPPPPCSNYIIATVVYSLCFIVKQSRY